MQQSYLNPTIEHVSSTASSFTCGTLLLLFGNRQPHSYARDMPHSFRALSAALSTWGLQGINVGRGVLKALLSARVGGGDE